MIRAEFFREVLDLQNVIQFSDISKKTSGVSQVTREFIPW